MKLDLKINTYYAGYDKSEIRSSLEHHLNRNISISNKFLGIVEPVK